MTRSNTDWFIHACFLSYKICYQKATHQKHKKEATETEDDDLGLDEVSVEESNKIVYK